MATVVNRLCEESTEEAAKLLESFLKDWDEFQSSKGAQARRVGPFSPEGARSGSSQDPFMERTQEFADYAEEVLSGDDRF